MSFKIINQIKKSNLPRPLKSVLEAYASFANRDGTSIRPTEAAVGARASMSRSAVSRHTQTLVGKGLLVHDLDEHGIHLKHAYGETGVWAYVYHLDARKLNDPALVAEWDEQKKAFIEKCRIAGAKNLSSRWAKGVSGNPTGLSKIQQQEQRDLRQTPPEGFATNPPEGYPLVRGRGICDTDPTLKSDPSPSADPSAGSPAVSQNQVSELVSEGAFASLTLQQLGVSEKEEPTYQESSYCYRAHKLNEPHNEHCACWISAEDFYRELFPGKTWTNEDIQTLITLAEEVGGLKGTTHGAHRIKQAWAWNHVHKTGKYLLYSVDELAKALRSTNDRSLLNQMDMHDGCRLCMPATDKPEYKTGGRDFL